MPIIFVVDFIVPMLRVGMLPMTLLRRIPQRRSVAGGVTARNVGTIKKPTKSDGSSIKPNYFAEPVQ